MEARSERPAQKRPRVHDRRFADLRKPSNATEHVFVESSDARTGRVLRRRTPQLHCQKVIAAEAGIDLLQVPQGSDEQPGADEKDQRQRHLDHENRSRGRAPCGLRGGPQGIRADRPERGRHTERYCCDERGGQRQEQHSTVNGHRHRSRDLYLRNERHQGPQADDGKHHTGRATERREQGAFREHLPDQPAPRRAQGGSSGDLALAHARTHEQQPRHVDARNQQHASHGRKQDQDRRLQRLVQRKHRDELRAPAIIGRRIGLPQIPRNPREICIRIGPRHS